MGRIVICAATTGFDLTFDVRHLWMRQKQIIGSHFAHAEQCWRANELILNGTIKPVHDGGLPPYADIPLRPRRHDEQSAHGQAFMSGQRAAHRAKDTDRDHLNYGDPSQS